MTKPPILCPHGVLGVAKCKECGREQSRRWRRKNGTKPRPTCPHGNRIKSTCKKCRYEINNKWRKNNLKHCRDYFRNRRHIDEEFRKRTNRHVAKSQRKHRGKK